MNRSTLFLLICLVAQSVLWASGTDTPAKPDSPEADQLQTPEESEQKGPDSQSDDAPSATPAITPVSTFTDKDIHQQALDELVKANDLWSKNQLEAASDAALEAYDDLGEIRHLRGSKRVKWRQQRHQAATVYVQSGIAYVSEYVRHAGLTWEAQQEGRSRLEDLRDVARDYPELDKLLNNAIQQIPNQKPQ